MNRRLLVVAAVLSLVAGLGLVGCGDDNTPSGDTVTCADGTELKDGACVPAGNLCPLGQVYANGECRAEMTTGLECGPGTEPNAAGTQCVSTGGGGGQECGPGTIAQGDTCVPDPDSLIECGAGTISDGAGACVAINPCDEGKVFDGNGCIDPPGCEAGTIANANGDCEPVDPTEDIEVGEGTENNDPALGEGIATPFTLGAEGTPVILGGVIEAPRDIVPEEGVNGADPVVILEPDFDGFAFSGGKGQRISIEGTAVGAPDLGWSVAYVPADETDEGAYERFALPLSNRNTQREYVLPYDGVYNVRVSTANNLETAAFQGGFAWEGGEDFSYLLAVTPLAPVAPETQVTAGFEWTGGAEGLSALPHLQVDVPEGTILDLSMTNPSGVVLGTALLTSPDFTAIYGTLDSGTQRRFEVPAGGLLITADFYVALDADDSFTITSLPVPIQGIADLNLTDPLQGELAESGGLDWYSFQISEPTVLSATLAAGDASRAQVGVLVADSEFNFFSPGSGPPPLYGDGPAALQAFLATPGTYYLAVLDLNRPGTFTGAYTYALNLSAVTVPLLGTGSLDLTTTPTLTGTADLAEAGDVAWFAVNLSEMLQADLTAVPTEIDTDLLLFEEGQITERTANVFEADGADAGLSAETEELTFSGEGWRLIRVSNVGDAGTDGLVTLTISSSNPFEGLARETEPNNAQDAAQAGGAVALDAPANIAGDLTDPASGSDDWYTFTIANPSTVTASTLPGPNAGADTIVTIVSAQGSPLARNDDFAGRGLYSSATAGVPAGTFYVLVQSFLSRPNGDYILTVNVDAEFPTCAPGYSVCNSDNLDVCNDAGDGFDATPCNNGCETIEDVGDSCSTDVELDLDNNDQWQGADEINLVIDGVTELDGDIGNIDLNGFEDLEDWYVFTLSASPDEQGFVTIEWAENVRTQFSTLPDDVTLYNATDLSTPIATGDIFDGSVGPLWLAPGTYYVKVESFGGFFGAFGGYRMVITHQSTVCEPDTGACAGADFNACNADGSAIELRSCLFGCGAQATGDNCNTFTETEPNGTGAEASDVGTIPADAFAPIEGSIDSDATTRDADWYSFTVDADAIVTLETSPSNLTGANVDTVIWLYDAAEVEIATNDDGGEGLFSLIGPRFVTAGTYLVKVQLFGATTVGAYHLDIRVDAPVCEVGAQACSGDDITLCNGLEFASTGTCDTGCTDNLDGTAFCNPPASTLLDPAVSVTAGNHDVADGTDWYSFELAATTTLTIGVSQGADLMDHDSRIFLCTLAQVQGGGCVYGFAGDNIDYDDNGGAAPAWSELALSLDAGTYYLGVELWDGEVGDYTLTIEEPPAGAYEPNDAYDVATPIGLGETLTAGIELGADLDWYTFTLAANTGVSITTDLGLGAASVDTRIWLCDSSAPESCTYTAGFLLKNDDGNGVYSLIEGASLMAGTYYIGVSSWGGTGDYDITLEEFVFTAPYEPNNSAAEATVIALGETLTAGVESGTDQDWFTFTLAADTFVTITTDQGLGAASVDTRIWLCDETDPAGCTYLAGNLARDDDTGAGNYSMISQRALSAGTYYIGVSSWGGSGDYDITLEEAMAPPGPVALSFPTMTTVCDDVPGYSFTLDADALVSFAVTPAAADDSRLILCTAASFEAGTCTWSGTYITRGDQGFGGELDSITDQSLVAGDYVLVVGFWSGRSDCYDLEASSSL